VFAGPERSETAQPEKEPLPSISDCATHLELLETFFVLRQKVLRTADLDAAFGIEEKHEVKTGRRGETKKMKDATLWNRRQAKWTKFVELATIRFLVWRAACQKDWSPFRLPPVDVLMVWHAFLLNPRLFATHCGKEMLYRVSFPWSLIHRYVDNNKWKFTLPDTAAETFETKTGLTSDLFGELARFKDEKMERLGHESLYESWANLELKKDLAMPEWIRKMREDSEIYKHFSALSIVDIDLATQLRDAVIRQGSFVEKMSNLMWIRSPALSGTLTRAVDRYGRFLHLMKLYPEQMLVPTLDIDLAWHTHQCSAVGYRKGTQERAGRFVNHDDTIVDNKLTDGFKDTRRLYRVHFGREYKVCGCWDCEALLSGVEEAMEARKESGEVPDMAAVVRKVEDDVMYYRIVEVARRKKKPLPLRG
jgi:hypothetical protein